MNKVDKSTLTLADFSRKVAKDLNITNVKANEAIKSVLDNIVLAVDEGRKIEFRGVFVIGSKIQKERTGASYLPTTGAIISSPAKRVAYFKAGSRLKNMRI